MPNNNLLQQMVIIVIIAGITSGSSHSLNANLIASLTYISIIIFPLCVWLALQGGTTYLMLSIAMITYLWFMLTTSVRGCTLLKKSLILHYEKSELIDNLSQSNKKLLQSNKILEQHEHEIALINKMNATLQICKKSNEAYEIINLTAKELFDNFNGALVILNSSSNLETVSQWGNQSILKVVFSMDDCFALRKGHAYLVNDTTKNLLCYHFTSFPSAYMCIPLIVQSGTIGLLVIHSQIKDVFTSYQLQLATSFSEVIKLSLTNIKLRETLYEQSIRDPLTALFNRRYLDETLQRELQRALREKRKLCVAMLDLDFFKNFNDASGHEAGDEILKYIGALLLENFRSNDIACRFGGEEFVVVLVNSDLINAYSRLQHIREKVKNAKIYYNGKLLPPITISIGIAEAPTQGNTVKDIIESSDKALYSAKQEGRDKVKCYS